MRLLFPFLLLFPILFNSVEINSDQTRAKSLLIDSEKISIVYVITEPDEERVGDIEFYDEYGILFDARARADGPLCFDLVNKNGLITRKCVLLSTIRTWLVSVK